MNQVAQIILDQLGGRQFLAMTGAYGLTADKESLTFRFRGSKNSNCCTVRLTNDDTYNMDFFKINLKKLSSKLVHSADNLYFDDLQQVFENVTQLYTRL